MSQRQIEIERKREGHKGKNLPVEDRLAINHKFLPVYKVGQVLFCSEAFVLNYLALLLMCVYHELPVNVKIKVPLYLLLTLPKWFT